MTAAGLIGLVLRLSRFLENRPLWTDEAKLALGIGRRGFIGLLQPLDYSQLAPVFYLWTLKLATIALGMSEWVLRLPSLIAGLLTMIVVWRLARRVTSEVGAVFAAVLAATAPLLVGYSAEAKPYELDALVSSVLLLLALRVSANSVGRPKQILGFSGIIAIGFSIPSLFVLGGISGALLFTEWRAKDWRRMTQTFFWSVVWLAAFVLQHHLTYSSDATSGVMNNFWSGVMIRAGASGWINRSAASVRSAMFAATDPGWRFLVLFAPVSAVIGITVILKRSGSYAALLLALPLILALIASALGLWPIDGRLALFLAPVAFVLLGAFADSIWNAPLGRGRGATRIALLACGIFGATYNVMHPSAFPPFEASRDLIRTLAPQREQEPIYVFPAGIPSWVYYSTDWRDPDTARLAWYARIDRYRISPSRRHPVMENEPGFVWNGNGGREIVGRSTGMQFAMSRGWITPAPDSGWGDSEAGRLAAEGSRSWVYGSHLTDSQVTSLRDGLERNNARIIGDWRDASAVLWRVHFN